MVRSSFFEYNVALTGLHVARGGLQVTGHNISNAATVGYSRQYVEQRASTPLSYGNGRGMFGTGSEIYGVGQWRNFFLDTKFRTERSTLGEYTAKRSQLTVLEGVFNELSDSGISANFTKFFQTLQDLSTVAGNATYRTNVTQAAQELTKFINNTAESLKSQQKDINEEVRTVVQTINSLGQQIRSLNEQISKFEMDGSQANDLRDQRALLLDELSLYVNIEVKEIETNEDYALGLHPDPGDRCLSRKELTVMINGYEFINNWDIIPMKVEPRDQKVHAMDVPNLYDVYFEGSNVKFDIYSPSLQGQLKGLIDVRDGNSGYYMTTTPTSTTTFSSTNTVNSFAINIADFGGQTPAGSGTIQVRNTLTNEITSYPYMLQISGSEYEFLLEPPHNLIASDLIAGGNYEIIIQDSGGPGSHTCQLDPTKITSPAIDTIHVTDPTRMDLDVNGGYVTVTDPASNLKVKYKYSRMLMNGDGSLTFEIHQSTPIRDSHIRNFPTELTVGQTSPYKGIPHYMDRLNELVRTFAEAINEGVDRAGDPIPGHMDGYDAYNQQLGIPLFTYGADVAASSGISSYYFLTCENLQVNQRIVNDPNLLASALEENAGIDDNRIIHGFFGIQSYESLFAEGKLEDFIVGTASELGIDLKQANNFEKNYTDITTTIDNQRISVSGVDLNEEFTSLMKYQQLYMSCAKLMSVINEIYGVTINQMGL